MCQVDDHCELQSVFRFEQKLTEYFTFLRIQSGVPSNIQIITSYNFIVVCSARVFEFNHSLSYFGINWAPINVRF